MKTHPAQLEMDFLLAHCYPLLNAEEAGFLLDRDQTTIAAMIDDGTLPAVNIALDTTGRRRVRLWRWAVLHQCIRPEQPMQGQGAAACLPHTRDLWLVREVAGLMRCSTDHVLNLYDARPADNSRLLEGPDRNANRSAGRAPRIWRDSLTTFLTSRTIK